VHASQATAEQNLGSRHSDFTPPQAGAELLAHFYKINSELLRNKDERLLNFLQFNKQDFFLNKFFCGY